LTLLAFGQTRLLSLLTLLRLQLSLPPRPTIVDLGCGEGADAAMYHAGFPGARLIGVDLDRAALRLAHRCRLYSLLLEADAAAVPLIACGDLILIRHPDVGRHPTGWAAVLAGVSRLVRPAQPPGIVLITTYAGAEIATLRPWLPPSWVEVGLPLERLAPVGLQGRDRAWIAGRVTA
jgi:SAM-dependent methyltransferase